MVEGKPYTVHQVKPGETFYSISVAYKVHVDSLMVVNRLAHEGAALHPGDMLIVPLYATKTDSPPTVAPVVPAPAPKVATPPVASNGYIQHVVITGENLYSVARQYPHTTLTAIKEANKLETENLSIGQILLIPAPKTATTPPPTPKPVAPVAPTSPQAPPTPIDSQAIYRPSGSQTTPPNTGAALVADTDDNATVASFDMKMLAEWESKYKANAATHKQETIKGTAVWMDDPSHENQYRFYAMHKSAPIGSIVKVKNLMNDRVVYVKVIGKMPSTKSNEKIIIKLSGGAARYLNVLDDKFMIELSMALENL